MDRETMDFRRSAASAAPAAEQATPTTEHRSYTRDRLSIPTQTSYPREQRGNVQTVTIQSILKGAREAIIDFDGAAYRLRITRNHRLILTK